MDWNLKTYGGVLYKGYIWFSNNTFNGLFRMNISTKKIEYIGFFPKISILNRLTHKKCFLYNDKLYFLPAFSNYIHIYDLKNKKFETIEFANSDQLILKDRVGDAVLLDDEIYIFSWLEEKPLIIFDLHSNTLKRCDYYDIQKENRVSKNFEVNRCFNYGVEKICLALSGTDCFAELDIHSKEFTVTHIGVEDIFSAIPIDDNIWIVPGGEDSIYRFDKESVLKKYDGIGCTKRNGGERYYSGVIKFNDMLIGVPAFAKKIVCWKEGNAYELDGDNWNTYHENLAAFLGTVELDDELWLLPFSADGIYSYSASAGIVTHIDFTVKEESVKKMIIRKAINEELKKGIIFENSTFTLPEYIYVLNKN